MVPMGFSQCSRKWLATMKSCEAGSIVENIGLGQVPVGQFGIFAAQVGNLQTIDVRHRDAWRHYQRLV